MKEFEVNVYTYRRTDGFGKPQMQRPPLVLAYTRHQGPGACVHHVMAASGYQAKRQAIASHKECPVYQYLLPPVPVARNPRCKACGQPTPCEKHGYGFAWQAPDATEKTDG